MILVLECKNSQVAHKDLKSNKVCPQHTMKSRTDHYSIFRPDRNLKSQCIKFQRNQFVVLECTLRRFLRTLVTIFVSILNYNKVVLSKGSHSQKIFCSLGLDAIVFCFGKQNCCKSLKIYIVFNLRNLDVFVFHVQLKTFFRLYLIFSQDFKHNAYTLQEVQ